MVSAGRVVFSVAEDSFPFAIKELRDEFGGMAVERAGPDVGIIQTPRPSVAEVAAACADRPLVFPKHLTVEMARVDRADAADLTAVTKAAVGVIVDSMPPTKLAVHVWSSGAPKTSYRSGDLFSALAVELAPFGFSVTRVGQEYVLSCCITPKGVLIGLTRTAHSLTNWPGGRVRLAKDEGQVSRAEFKLEELLQIFPLSLPAAGRAIDLGASPGGWTRILRQHGLTVWAVDPGELHPRIASDPGVHHVCTTAGEFFRSTDTTFDLAVDDMRMDPALTSDVMIDAASHLRPGGLAVITLKIGDRRPVETVRRCLTILDRAYQIEHARQLHHNRREVTVVARRRTL